MGWDFLFDVPPYRLSGQVYGVLLNDVSALDALGDAVDAAPYKGRPKAPVLYFKPRNTLVQDGGAVVVPAATAALELGASLGLVIGRTACAVSKETALDYVAGYTIVADFSVPHQSFYRPSVRFKALDHSCLIGPVVTARAQLAHPDALAVRVYADGALVHEASTAGMVRGVAQLLVDVTEFMTLQPGDVLMLGVAAGAPLVCAGQTVRVEIEGLGALENTLTEEAA